MQNTSFRHSVKVPKLYKCAAKISQEVAGGNGSIKQLVYEKKHFNTKALYALVVTTFQKAKEIDLLLKRTKLLEKEPRLDPWVAKILISEVLWGKKQLPKSDAKPIQTILAYEQAFHAHLSDSSEDVTTAKTDIYRKPRYVRINTLINPFNEALELFENEGWTLQTPNGPNDYENFLEHVSNLEGDFVLKDLHIPDLLIFPGGTEFYNHPGYKKGAIVLQDKASCLPVHLLSPPPGSVVLDMCAAPGMKTTQLATMLQNEGTVYAVERDPKRFEVLIKMVESSGATCIKTINKDVLECGNNDFPDVEYILVDPSCSASGMTDRLELQQNRDHSRLQKLAGFQIKILRSALTRYPKVKKVVYSTCSLYPEENEDVVRQVLETNNQFKLVPASEFINNTWKNFGSADFGDIGKYCLYARPEEDLTNGFFVAVLERLEDGETNQFFNGRVLNYRKNVEQKQARKEKRFKEKTEGSIDLKSGQNNKHCNIKSDLDVEVNDNIRQKITDENMDEVIEKDKTNKRKLSDVDTINQASGNEYLKKPKKTKKHHGEVENLIQTDEQNCNIEEIDESLKKSKKKKRKNNEQGENFQQTYEDCKKPKKKRKHMEIGKPEEIYNENEMETYSVDHSDGDMSNKTDKSLKKSEKKKNRHTLEAHDKYQKINDFAKQNIENTSHNLATEEIGLKKSKKNKKRSEEERAENFKTIHREEKPLNKDNLIQSVVNTNEQEAEATITTTLKRSKKKKGKYTLDEQLTNFKYEHIQQINDDSLLKNKKKKKHSTLDSTT